MINFCIVFFVAECSDIRKVSDCFDFDQKNLISHEVFNKLRAIYLPNDQLTLFIRVCILVHSF